MKHFLSRLVPVLLPACMVDTPVVDSPDSGVGSDRLGANLGAWCDSACARLNSSCEPPDEEDDCVPDCIDAFGQTFADKSSACTEAGLRLMDCIETASCSELTSGEGCNRREEIDLCHASLGFVTCSSSSSGVGGAAGGGGTAGYAGTDEPGLGCELDIDGCSNGSVYRLSCDGAGDPPACHCMIDDQVFGSFTPDWQACPDEPLPVSRICGWPIVMGRPEPDQEPPIQCDVMGEPGGSSGGGSARDCGAFFRQCSDGHDYEVHCQGSAGAGNCECFVDGESWDSRTLSAGLCSFESDPSGPKVAANYLCDFNLAPF